MFAAAVDQLRRRERIGISEALNRIARAGLTSRATRQPFRQRSFPMGPFKVDVTCVAEAIERVEGPGHR
jgi:hypothetical protein